MKNKLILFVIAITAIGLTACTRESTSTTNFSFSTTTDDGTTDYSYKSENVNGEVTTESSVTETNYDDDDINSGVLMEAGWLDDGLTDGWDHDKTGHDVSYDEDTIYIHIWSGEIASSDELDEEDMRNNTIPSWIEATQDWMEKFKEDGFEDLHVCLQDVSRQGGEVFFTIEDGEVTYFVLDE
jgi:hypothetical protein